MQLLIELVVEELPASFVRPALAAMRTGVQALLEGIEFGAVRTYATPRRLCVVVDGVEQARPVVERTVTGPPADRAYKDGEPTKAALGFARGKGVDASALRIVEGPRGPVVAVDVSEGGETSRELLQAGLNGMVLGIPFRKSMEWGDGGVRFARPLHRVNVVLGGEVVHAQVAGIQTGAETIGHRLNLGPIPFLDEASWLEGLRAHDVEPDLLVRAGQIQAILLEAADTIACDAIVDDALLEEVLHLVECPVKVVGSFDPGMLELPSRLLIKVMRAHQRYFPTFRDGVLTEHFVVISNNPYADQDRVRRGNSNVLGARFHDARFFFAEDRKTPLSVHGAQLDKMRWIRGLGSVADKGERLAELGAALAPMFGADPAQVEQAARLCKCDLATLMVGEFGDLQGHIGRLYATAEGVPAPVAEAIEDHYRPLHAGDAPANHPVSATLAVADRLDSLAGCFGIGMVPKGSGDPQGLRRAVLGVLETLQARGVRTELAPLFAEAVAVFERRADQDPARYTGWKQADSAIVVQKLVDFASGRFRANATRQGVSGDLVDAVLAVGSTDTIDRQARLNALLGVAKTNDFVSIMKTFKRVLNITRDVDFPAPEQLEHPAEHALSEASSVASAALDAAIDGLDYPAAFDAALSLDAPVAAFFDAVMVDDSDPLIRARRMGLLLVIARSFLRLADFSRISTR